MTELRPLALLVMTACGPVLGRGDELGGPFTLVGPVADDVEVSGADTRAYVAWAWLVDGRRDGVATEAGFEPRIHEYALGVPAPPPVALGTSPSPSDLGPDGVVLLAGVPVLVEPDPGAEPEVTVDAGAVWAWVAGDAGPDGVVTVTGGRWAAVAVDHVLLLAQAPGYAGLRLAPAPAWEVGGPLCRLDGAVVGLTVYRAAALGCLGLEPLAAPGTRTEFQGIGLSAAP